MCLHWFSLSLSPRRVAGAQASRHQPARQQQQNQEREDDTLLSANKTGPGAEIISLTFFLFLQAWYAFAALTSRELPGRKLHQGLLPQTLPTRRFPHAVHTLAPRRVLQLVVREHGDVLQLATCHTRPFPRYPSGALDSFFDALRALEVTSLVHQHFLSEALDRLLQATLEAEHQRRARE